MEIAMDTWSTTVTELVSIFRGSLIAVIPWLEKAKIKWREGESYDDWDNIAECHYENIVCNSLTGQTALEYNIAKYSMDYKNYSNLDFILAKSTQHKEKILVFVAFQTETTPLDTVKVAWIDNSFCVVDYLTLKHEALIYSYVKRNGGTERVVDEISITL